MITLSSTFSGTEVSAALVNDPEELAYCLTEFATELRVADYCEVADHVDDAEKVSAFLRALADQIYPQKENSDV